MSRFSAAFAEPAIDFAEALLPRQLLAQSLGDDGWIEAAENCLLAKFDTMRILGGLPRNLPPLSRPELITRLSELLALWDDGCGYAIDERLFADVLARRRG